MKILRLLPVFLILPLVFHAQQSLSGLWIGSLDNDSATIRKDQAFEIALTEYKGKVYGYSRMTFTVNDTLYYIIKRIKGKIDGDVCEVKDDEIIRHNFPRKPDKGVKLVSTFRRNQQDSIWKLEGDWKTTESKRHGYYSISGNISLTSEPDLSKSKLFPHLEELDLAKNVEFYATAKKKDVEAEKKNLRTTVNQSASPTRQPSIAKTGSADDTQQPVSQKKKAQAQTSLASVEPGQNKSVPPVQQKALPTDEAIEFTGLKKTTTPVNNTHKEEKNITAGVSRPQIRSKVDVKENKPVIEEEVAQKDLKKVDSASLVKLEPRKTLPSTEMVKPSANSSSAAAYVAERKVAAPQVLEFKSDSLVIKLYDNGEIDGDTVSVLLNGEILLAKQGLKASAIRKTIYIQPGQDEVNLVLYAENLGKYPPNTGLLIVNDGETTHQLRFSADLQQNASVIFRRKK